MSGHGDPHEAAGEHDEHDEHDDHHAPPPLEEPATPLWLTVLGVALFLLAGIAFVAMRPDGKTTAELTAVPSADAAASAAPTVAAAPAAPNPALRVKAPSPAARPEPAARP